MRRPFTFERSPGRLRLDFLSLDLVFHCIEFETTMVHHFHCALMYNIFPLERKIERGKDGYGASDESATYEEQ